jgi:starch phosphorylase
MLNRGFCGESFSNISHYLLTESPIADPYMCLADYEPYMEAYRKAAETYAEPLRWNRMSLCNIAAAGRFAADTSVKNYAEKIWGAEPISYKRNEK